ncbi:SPOR domain-containing protein [Stenotrophomonas sp. 24(2023)]|uniref:SPOR domain-containing protein n=1 Tax=Stenotrophomonas sp. 24(2023) TaxID=3068324 RepID=UPI0027E18E47|nr:SPOR domain-containing protein [Stenotrophomonas sp. 24(2023)]WMJ71334.1 SPOR domain-containing protein [Stenotrophomonas sp. 24(2023)]
MLTRALIVVLAILNLGVAAWWLLRQDPAEPAPALPAGVAELQWLPGGDTPVAPAPVAATTAAPALTDRQAEATAAAAPPTESVAAAAPPVTPSAPVAVPAPTPAPAPAPPPAAPARCLALGPFADRAAAAAAQARAGTLLAQARLREQPAASGTTRYRVLLPAAASREQVQANAQRIVAAGLGDYYVIAQGEDINAVALGQYRNREGAERRMAAVQAAGFQPRLVASGEAGQWWVDARLASDAQPAQAQQRSGAAGQRSLECTRLR